MIRIKKCEAFSKEVFVEEIIEGPFQIKSALIVLFVAVALINDV